MYADLLKNKKTKQSYEHLKQNKNKKNNQMNYRNSGGNIEENIHNSHENCHNAKFHSGLKICLVFLKIIILWMLGWNVFLRFTHYKNPMFQSYQGMSFDVFSASEQLSADVAAEGTHARVDDQVSL